MWIFTDYGFFSVVRDALVDGHLLVRARCASDLDDLRTRLSAVDGIDISAIPVRDEPDADYRYKVSVPSEALAVLLAEETAGIGYTNFKGRVAHTLGHGRADLYHDVWETMARLQPTAPYAGRVLVPAPPRRSPREKQKPRGRRA